MRSRIRHSAESARSHFTEGGPDLAELAAAAPHAVLESARPAIAKRIAPVAVAVVVVLTAWRRSRR